MKVIYPLTNRTKYSSLMTMTYTGSRVTVVIRTKKPVRIMTTNFKVFPKNHRKLKRKFFTYTTIKSVYE